MWLHVKWVKRVIMQVAKTDLIANLQLPSTCPKGHQITTECYGWGRVQLSGKKYLRDRAVVIIWVTLASINDKKILIISAMGLPHISCSKLAFFFTKKLTLRENPANAHCIEGLENCFFCRYPGVTPIRMKKSGPSLRQELGDVSYLEAHSEVCRLFQEVGCYKFYEKIQGSISRWLKLLPYHLKDQKQS